MVIIHTETPPPQSGMRKLFLKSFLISSHLIFLKSFLKNCLNCVNENMQKDNMQDMANSGSFSERSQVPLLLDTISM